MSRSSWTVYSKATGSWVADGSIYRPNDDVELKKNTTQVAVQLADGDEGFVTPTTKYLNEPIILKWYQDDGTVKTKVEGYLENGTPVKIVDHNAVSYVGKFTSISPTWLVGYDGDYYDIEATFKIMPALA